MFYIYEKNPFSVVNIIDARNYVFLDPNKVKFLCNINGLNVYIVHIHKRVKYLYILLASISYVDKTSINYDASI